MKKRAFRSPFADVRGRITDVEEQVQTLESSPESTTSEEADQTSSQTAETPLERICALPEQIADRELTTNQDRARFIARDVRDYAEKAPAGLVIDSQKITKVLTAAEGTKPHTQTVARVMDFLEKLGKDEVEQTKRRGKKLVENRTEYANKIHGLLSDHGITREVKPLSVEGREFLQELSLPAPWNALLESYLELIQTLTEQIESLEAEIEERAGSRPETQLLMTIPGVSYFTALTIYAELGETDRFDRAKEVVSYVGLNPIIRESGDSRFEGSISKKGSGRVRWLLVQASYTAVHTCEDEYLSRFYNRLARKKNSKTAIVATARKLLVSIYHMLDREEVYDPPGVSA